MTLNKKNDLSFRGPIYYFSIDEQQILHPAIMTYEPVCQIDLNLLQPNEHFKKISINVLRMNGIPFDSSILHSDWYLKLMNGTIIIRQLYKKQYWEFKLKPFFCQDFLGNDEWTSLRKILSHASFRGKYELYTFNSHLGVSKKLETITIPFCGQILSSFIKKISIDKEHVNTNGPIQNGETISTKIKYNHFSGSIKFKNDISSQVIIIPMKSGLKSKYLVFSYSSKMNVNFEIPIFILSES